MIKLPSTIKSYSAVYSKDSAFIQLPDDATEEQAKEHARKWKVARETGEYGGLLLEGGGAPSVFTMRPLTAAAFSYLTSLAQGGSAPIEISSLAFRFSVQSVTHFSDAEIKQINHPQLGLIASLSFFDKAGAPAKLAVSITDELGGFVLEKASVISPS